MPEATKIPCLFCDFSGTKAELIKHSANCEKHPLRAERDRLREAAEELLAVARLRGDNRLPDPGDDENIFGWTARMQTAWDQLDAALASIPAPADERYYYDCGGTRLRWGHPENVQHLILQLQTFDPEMKVSSVTFLDLPEGRKARAYGLSMSRERWDERGWLNFALPGPECLAIWATRPENVQGVNATLVSIPAPDGERRDSEPLFYIQNVGFNGNCLLWWRPNGNGYTTDLNDAWKVSEAKARSICRSRPKEDIAWPASEIDRIASRHLNCEHLWRECIAPLANPTSTEGGGA
jgi:hypothetical protein